VHFIKRDELNEDQPEKVAAALERDALSDGALPGLSEARYDMEARDLADAARCRRDHVPALIGHLSRAGVVIPTPSPQDRVVGRLVKQLGGRERGLLRSSIADAARARWRQYREIWAYVESDSCRRRTILRHFGDHAEPTATAGPGGETYPCCDACGADLLPELPRLDTTEAIASLDEAIFSVARTAKPEVGRTTCAEIIHGARTKKIERNSYDGLAAYATASHMRRADILARIDELIGENRLATSRGPYPVLKIEAAPAAA
jgi:ATP-dependent DNA helicase RecQ